MTNSTEIFNQVREIVALETNHEEDEISPDSHFVDDLSIDLEDENNGIFKRIVARINDEFDIKLDMNLFLDEESENQVVSYLTELVKDEIDL
ncbi:MAG: hypothetical protein ABFQ62_02255 [Patescibacteria group bacterium]